MKANEWPLDFEKEVNDPDSSMFPGIRNDEDKPCGDWLLIIKNESIGCLQDEGGNAITKSFFTALIREEIPPATILFMGKGVSLTCKNSPVLDQLLALEQRQIEILSSAACLESYNLRRELCIGKMTSMSGIVSMISQTLRVVTL